ncbi:hypothetical protein KIPB_011123, partial [Kipferlia bialata]
PFPVLDAAVPEQTQAATLTAASDTANPSEQSRKAELQLMERADALDLELRVRQREIATTPPLFSLFHASGRAFVPKRRSMNHRIVVVGSGDTCRQACQTLLDNSTSSTNMWVLSDTPDVLMPPTSDEVKYGVAEMTVRHVSDACLGARLPVIEGAVQALNKEERCILLANGTLVYYDILLLATEAEP